MTDHTISERDLERRLQALAAATTVPGADELSALARRATAVAADRPSAGRRRRPWALPRLGVGVAVAAALVVAAVLAATALRSPSVAAAGVHFRRSHGFIVARITDPAASAAALRQAFAEEGLNIHLSLIPVSPSLVGTVVYIGEDGGGIQAIQGGPCVTGGGGCPVGLRIPADYAGEAYITLGREAQAGESYGSTASAFAPGEPLHCTGLVGKPVAVAQRELARRGLTAEWRIADGTGGDVDETTVTNDTVVGAEHMAAGRLLMSVSANPAPLIAAERAYLDQLSSGC